MIVSKSIVASTVVALSLSSGALYAGDYANGGTSTASDSDLRHTGIHRAVYHPQGYDATVQSPGNYRTAGSGLTGGGFIKVASHSKQQDVVDVAVSAGSFTTLVTAVKAADLVGTLKGEGPFTVFAPTDEAFAKIPEDQLAALLMDKDALTAVLTYHVVPGKVMAADVMGLSSAKTVQGQSVTIDTSDGVTVDGAKVVKTDILASNGVIHVIDTVLMPKM